MAKQSKAKVKIEKPEFSSIESFIQMKIDDDDHSFDHNDLQELSFYLRRANLHGIRVELESHGLTLQRREHDKRVRGFTTSSHDRWYGPGSCPTHGGSGFDNRE